MGTLMNRGGLFDELLRDFSPAFYVRPLHGEGLPAASQIKVDVKEDSKSFTVHAEIPGVAKENIHVAIDQGLVTLQAEIVQQDSERKDDKVLRSERYYGSVSRSLQLPSDVDVSQAKATYDQGILTLLLPKKEGRGVTHLTIE